jgi:hypothetical protein
VVFAARQVVVSGSLQRRSYLSGLPLLELKAVLAAILGLCSTAANARRSRITSSSLDSVSTCRRCGSSRLAREHPLQKKQSHDASRSCFKSDPTPHGVFFQPGDSRGHSGTEARRKPLTSAAEREVSGGLTTTLMSSGHQRQHTAIEAFAVRFCDGLGTSAHAWSSSFLLPARRES